MSNVSLNAPLAQSIRMDLSAYADLPPAGERWRVQETDLDCGDINRLLARSVIEPVDIEDGDRVWQTREHVWEEIERQRDELGVLACGHRPFRTVNLDADRPYSCRRDDCDARYTRAEIEAVVDG
jgi:hypothetical protein